MEIRAFAASDRAALRELFPRVGAGSGHRLAHCRRVEHVEHDRLGSEPAQPCRLVG
jgi:hypothetical protein